MMFTSEQVARDIFTPSMSEFGPLPFVPARRPYRTDVRQCVRLPLVPLETTVLYMLVFYVLFIYCIGDDNVHSRMWVHLINNTRI